MVTAQDIAAEIFPNGTRESPPVDADMASSRSLWRRYGKRGAPCFITDERNRIVGRYREPLYEPEAEMPSVITHGIGYSERSPNPVDEWENSHTVSLYSPDGELRRMPRVELDRWLARGFTLERPANALPAPVFPCSLVTPCPCLGRNPDEVEQHERYTHPLEYAARAKESL